MQLISLSEACQLLDITITTLYRWLKRAEIEPKQDENEYDQRKKYITASQLQQLAMKHNRQLPNIYKPSAIHDDRTIMPLEASETNQRLNVLLQRIEAIENRLNAIETQLEKAPKHVAPAKAEYKLAEPEQVPPGSILMREFARRHKKPSRDWYQLRIDRGEIDAIVGSYHDKPQYWLNPEQQRAALAYVREKGIQVGQCGNEACPCHGNREPSPMST